MDASTWLSWKQQYAHAVGAVDINGDIKMLSAGGASSSSNSSGNSVQQFLESVLVPTSPNSKASTSGAAPSQQQQPSLAEIGQELLIPLTELSMVKLRKEQRLDRDAVLRVLQLQVICRLLCCCGISSEKTKKKKQSKKQAQKTKQIDTADGPTTSQLKVLKKEIRSLLDRIALLLDAANPPSLTDEDERSPFHEFLQDFLAKTFAKRLPKLVKFLLAVYELEDESRGMENLTLNPQLLPVAKATDTQASPAAAIPPAAAVPSILSALLRDEQRPLKRSRTETEVPFKKMQLPNELKRRSSFPSTRRDLLNAVTKAGSTTSASVPSSAASSRSTTDKASSSKPLSRSISTSSSRRRAAKNAEKPSLTPQNSLGQRLPVGSKAAPLLVRNVDRALFAGPQSRFTPSASNNTPHTLLTSNNGNGNGAIRPLFGTRHSPLATTPKGFKPVMPGTTVIATTAASHSTGPPRTAVSNLIKNERASVVMRTPDRPQRRPHRAARVLIESSPPFRNPNVGAGAAAARQRKQPNAIPPPLLR